MSDILQKITNFGGNQSWYSRIHTPASEAEVIDILTRHPGMTVKAIGSGHSWSDAAGYSDLVLDMSRLNSVSLIKADGQDLVRVGAGCSLRELLDRLHAATDRTLPTLGVILKQTISGAISTGTHGSGKQSLSHFVAAVRMAVFETTTGHPVVREFTQGPELEAARCGLGCAGVILSVDLCTVPKYMVAETVRIYQSVEDIIATFSEHPLSNFAVSPYGWTLAVFERKPVEPCRQTLLSRARADFFRLYGFIVIDVLFHVGLYVSLMLGAWAVRAYLRLAPHSLIKNCERVDDSVQVLTTRHDLFRHEEMEIFVKESELARALRFMRAAIESFAATDVAFPAEFIPALTAANLFQVLETKRGAYTHHYPLFCRRILPEDTMMSMAAATGEPMYSISVFTFDGPEDREPYYEFCHFVAYSLLRLVDARLHWGKHFPFEYKDLVRLYPRLEEFRALCRSHDPHGVLRNGYTKHVLNLPVGPS